jgi:pyruvate dehydrogenase E2 component (dihydrolipoamide acetyltransferase)
MAKIITLNKMTDTMTEGVLVKWNVSVGATVKGGDILAEVETDKATMDLENFEKGVILSLLAEEGSTLPVNSPIAIVGKEGEDISSLMAQISSPSGGASNSGGTEAENTPAVSETASTVNPTATVTPSAVVHEGADSSRLLASPLARKMAADSGIDLTLVKGSGEGGRIVKKDIENYTPAPAGNNASAYISSSESYHDVAVTQMRKTIAGRLADSKFTAPHFYLSMEIKMDRVLDARKRINESGEVKISVNDMIVKACAMALRRHPQVNSSWLGDRIRYHHHIHIGVAVAVDDGLLVPVVKFADAKDLSTISSEVKVFSKKAHEKKLQPTDWQGNTFTISNLGMFGIDQFTAIINPPDACILAVGGVKEQLALVNGEIQVENIMKVTLSCDHRVVDGVVGSKFLQTLKSYLEDPIRMLV